MTEHDVLSAISTLRVMRHELDLTQDALMLRLSEVEAAELLDYMSAQWLNPNAYPHLKGLIDRLDRRPK